jgi:hypothetical protein
MVYPQLKLELPLKSGELMGFSANLLAHHCTLITWFGDYHVYMQIYFCRCSPLFMTSVLDMLGLL